MLCEWKPKVLKQFFFIIQITQSNVSLQACFPVQSTVARSESLRRDTSGFFRRKNLLSLLLIHRSHTLLWDWVVHGARVLYVGSLLVPVVVIILQVWRRRAVSRLRHLRPADGGVLRGAVVPDRGGGRGIAGHGVAGVGTVLQGDLAVLVQLLELRPAVLEPDLDLGENTSVNIN